MKFLVDANLSPRLCDKLGALGHDAVHAWSLGLGSAPDEVLLEQARSEDRVLISADSDLGPSWRPPGPRRLRWCTCAGRADGGSKTSPLALRPPCRWSKNRSTGAALS